MTESQGGAAGEPPMAFAGEAGYTPATECSPGGQQGCLETAGAGNPITLKDGQVCSLGSDCATGVCNVFHQDSDSDGYGSSIVSTKVCGATAPAGYVADGTDCCDADPKAHPGQGSYFASKSLCNNYDYDCVSGEQLDPSSSAVLAWTKDLGSGLCSIQTAGWATTPTCGSAGTYYSGPCTCEMHGSGENGSPYSCSVATAVHAPQGCH